MSLKRGVEEATEGKVFKGGSNGLMFQVGQEVEVKSFKKGYRGAWFRCKVLKTQIKNAEVQYKVRYMDYPDEKTHLMSEYQVHRSSLRKIGCMAEHAEHMIRPSSSVFSRKKVLIPETTVLIMVHRDWKVGDEAEWWTKYSWWKCTIKKITNNNVFEVALPDDPNGEGNSYETSRAHLRPALFWSKQDSWRICLQDLTDPVASISNLNGDTECLHPRRKKVRFQEKKIVIENNWCKGSKEEAENNSCLAPRKSLQEFNLSESRYAGVIPKWEMLRSLGNV